MIFLSVGICTSLVYIIPREKGNRKMGVNDYGRFNHTLQECRKGLMRDMAEFGERYTVLAVALTLLDNQETQELVRRWFDLYI